MINASTKWYMASAKKGFIYEDLTCLLSTNFGGRGSNYGLFRIFCEHCVTQIFVATADMSIQGPGSHKKYVYHNSYFIQCNNTSEYGISLD